MTKKYVDLSEWIVKVCQSGEYKGCKDIHFNWFKDFDKNKCIGYPLLDYSLSLLFRTRIILDKIDFDKVAPLIELPVFCTEKKIENWSEEYWKELGKDYGMPNLFLYAKHKDLQFYKNGYVTDLKVFPGIGDKKITGFFRCYLNQSFEEYFSHVYLYFEGDF